MVVEQCIWSICFVPLDGTGQKFFGFSEFLAALALLVLAWTNADVRYRFRVATAPIPIYRITFVMVVAIGVLTLLTDLWRAETWLVPSGGFISPAGWQALLGALFLTTFVLWIWFAFIKPPVFGRWNAFRFTDYLYSIILKGKADELAVIAEEFSRSARSIVEHSWTSHEMSEGLQGDREEKRILKGRMRVKTHAHAILLMIGDKKFCRQVVQNSPATAGVIFKSIAKLRKYRLPIEIFARNITAEAIGNKDSFVYNEIDGYKTGYIGHYKPISMALYGNYEMAEGVRRVFDVDYRERINWDAEQWEAFQRLVLLCLENYIKESAIYHHSYVLHRAVGEISDSLMHLQVSDGSLAGDYFARDPYKKLEATIDFVRKAIKVLDRLDNETLRFAAHRDNNKRGVFRLVAEVMANAVFAASTVKSPSMTSWGVQYGAVWSQFFGLRDETNAAKIVHAIFFRLLLQDLKDMDIGPNYKGVRVLGMLLNVMGLEMFKMAHDKGYAPFQRTVLMWTRRKFASLYEDNPEVVETCLPDAISYDSANYTLIKTYEKGLGRESSQRFLKVDPPVRENSAKKGPG